MIRKIHLDFHTSPSAHDVGKLFNAADFAKTLSEAHVTDLVVPGKCHYGMAYFPTKVGVTHPHLKIPNLLGEIVRACLKENIRVQAYYSLGIDAVSANNHPEWRQQKADGTYASWSPVANLMCFASSYIDEFVLPQIEEIIGCAPDIAGFWFDICLYDSGAYWSEAFNRRVCIEGGSSCVKERKALARKILDERALQINKYIAQRLPNAVNYYNSLVTPGNLLSIDKQEFCEIEVPPFFSGYDYYPSAVRCLRAADKKVISLTSRFQRPWEDMGTLRSRDQILFDISCFMAAGTDFSIGDHLNAAGQLDRRVYKRIEEIYHYVKEMEPWIKGYKPVKEVGVLFVKEKLSESTLSEIPELIRGIVRILSESSIQCDVVNENSDFSKYKVILFMGDTEPGENLAMKIKKYVARGGSVLASGNALKGLEDIFGARLTERYFLNGCYIRPTEMLKVDDWTQVLYGRQQQIDPESDACILAYWLKASVDQGMDMNLGWISSPSEEKVGPAIIQKDRCIYMAAALLEDYEKEGTSTLREWIAACVDRLLGERLIKHSAGNTVEAAIHEGENGRVLHFVQWAFERWPAKQCYASEAPLLGPIEVSLKLEKPPANVSLLPENVPLEWVYESGRVHFVLPGMKVHRAIAIR